MSVLPCIHPPGSAFAESERLEFWHAAFLALFGLLAVLLAGCVADGYGGYDYGAGYYYPSTTIYGDWGPDYYVGPYRRGYFDHGRVGGHPPGRPFRPAPASRPMPSMPSFSHGGGHHGGGRR